MPEVRKAEAGIWTLDSAIGGRDFAEADELAVFGGTQAVGADEGGEAYNMSRLSSKV